MSLADPLAMSDANIRKVGEESRTATTQTSSAHSLRFFFGEDVGSDLQDFNSEDAIVENLNGMYTVLGKRATPRPMRVVGAPRGHVLEVAPQFIRGLC